MLNAVNQNQSATCAVLNSDSACSERMATNEDLYQIWNEHLAEQKSIHLVQKIKRNPLAYLFHLDSFFVA